MAVYDTEPLTEDALARAHCDEPEALTLVVGSRAVLLACRILCSPALAGRFDMRVDPYLGLDDWRLE